MIFKKNITVILLLIFFVSNIKSQTLNYSNKYIINAEDSTVAQLKKSDSKKPGGIFITPSLGVEFPLFDFKSNSKSALSLGVKLEFASLSTYPFVFGLFYDYRDHTGNDNYKTINFINTLETKVSSFGGGVDIILNKILKSYYTIPFLITEIRYMKMQRIINSSIAIPATLKTSDNIIGFTGGIGITLYIFDIYTTYTYAKDLSSFAFKLRFHFPVLKF